MERRSAGSRPRPGPMTVRRSVWRSPLVIVTAVALLVTAGVIGALFLTSNSRRRDVPRLDRPTAGDGHQPVRGRRGDRSRRRPGRARGLRRLPVPVVREVRARDAARPRPDVCRRGPAPDRGTGDRIPRQRLRRRVARRRRGSRMRRARRQVLDVRRLPRLEPVGRERGGVQPRPPGGHGGAGRSRTGRVHRPASTIPRSAARSRRGRRRHSRPGSSPRPPS